MVIYLHHARSVSMRGEKQSEQRAKVSESTMMGRQIQRYGMSLEMVHHERTDVTRHSVVCAEKVSVSHNLALGASSI